MNEWMVVAILDFDVAFSIVCMCFVFLQDAVMRQNMYSNSVVLLYNDSKGWFRSNWSWYHLFFKLSCSEMHGQKIDGQIDREYFQFLVLLHDGEQKRFSLVIKCICTCLISAVICTI